MTAATTEQRAALTASHDESTILSEYVAHAPLALAAERSVECRLYLRRPLARPVLDIGCGDGLFASILFDAPVDTGVDPDPRELESACRRGAYRELIQCFGDAIPKPDGSYKTIFSNSVLEHIPSLEPVLAEIYRLLAPDGHCYLTVPTDRFERYTFINITLETLRLRGLAARYRAFFNGFWRHYHCYTPDKWGALVREKGFHVIELRTYGPKHMCVIDDLMAPLGFGSFVTKKLFNRWTLFAPLRCILLFPAYVILRRIHRGAEWAEAGGLLFLALTKRVP